MVNMLRMRLAITVRQGRPTAKYNCVSVILLAYDTIGTAPRGTLRRSERPPRATIVRVESSKKYVKAVEGAYLVGDTRVSLDSLVFLFREGMSPESMVESYPALSLEQVHGALAFYLANQMEIDGYLAEGYRDAESRHAQSRQTNAELIAKLQRARHASQIPS